MLVTNQVAENISLIKSKISKLKLDERLQIKTLQLAIHYCCSKRTTQCDFCCSDIILPANYHAPSNTFRNLSASNTRFNCIQACFYFCFNAIIAEKGNTGYGEWCFIQYMRQLVCIQYLHLVLLHQLLI